MLSTAVTHTTAVRRMEAAHTQATIACENLLAIAESCAAQGDLDAARDAIAEARLPRAILATTTKWKAAA